MVTVIQEVDIKEAYVFGTGNRHVVLLNVSQRIGFDSWNEAILIRDVNQEDLDPQPALTNQQFIDWENERLAAETTETNQRAARGALVTLAETATQFTGEIAFVFTSIKQAQFDQLSDTATFTQITNTLTDPSISNGFRNTVISAYEAQGITLNLVDLELTLLPDKRAFNAFADAFFTSWAFMAFLGKTTF